MAWLKHRNFNTKIDPPLQQMVKLLKILQWLAIELSFKSMETDF